MAFHLEPRHQHGVGFLYRGHYADPRFGGLLFALDFGEVTGSYHQLTNLRANEPCIPLDATFSIESNRGNIR